MRRMVYVGFLAGVLIPALPAQAQIRNTVRVDFAKPVVVESDTRASAPVARQGASARGTNRWRGSGRFGVGIGDYGDAIDDNCTTFVGEFDATCDGDASGFTWMAAADVHYLLTDSFSFGVRGAVTKLSQIRLDAGGTFEGIDISATGEGSGFLVTLGPEGRLTLTPRIQLYGGVGLSPFTFDTTLTLSAFGQSESETQDNSGVGRTLWGGVEWIPSARDPWAIYAEFHRTSLKDDDVGADEEPFDESFKGFFVGVRVNFGR